MTLVRTLLLSSLLPVLALLSACSDPVASPAEAPAVAAPVMKGTQLHFPAGHPQLALLGLAPAEAAQPIVVDLPARLVWNEDRTQRIQPAFAGRVDRILVDVGQAVRAGSVLAQLASPEFGTAQAEAAKARADMVLSQKTLQRLIELHEAGVAARKDLEQAEADAARAQAEVQRAEARIRLYGAGVGVDQRLALTAGMSGVVVERNLNPGQELRPDSSAPAALFVISDPSSLWVQIDARESEVGTLRPGAVFELTVPALAGETFRGTVAAVADAIDASSRTIKVRGLVSNPRRRLKAEMLASARITRATASDAVVIPASSVQLRGGTHWVMVQPAPGVFEPREITVVWLGAKEVTVQGGLKRGEQVVADNLLLLARQYRQALEATGQVSVSGQMPGVAPAGERSGAGR